MLLKKDDIRIVRKTFTDDGGGGVTESGETEIYSGRGYVKQMKPQRTLEAAQLKLTSAIEVELWRAGLPAVKEGDILLHGGKSYAFTGPFLPADTSDRTFIATALQLVVSDD